MEAKNPEHIDPVCGMDVEESSPWKAEHQGTTYRFCSEHCRKRFLAAPNEFTTNRNGHAEEQPSRSVKQRQSGRGSSWKDYLPLIIIVTLALLVASAKSISYSQSWSGMIWMHDFMGIFLVVFSMFKLFDLEGFADGFQMYDLLAKRFRPYAYTYPFIELALGLGYLAHWQPLLIYGVTVVIMIFGAVGVIRALAAGLDIECACMGTVLRVPLSTVALGEDLGMAGMAAVMLLTTI
jgi:YHS domain-containing protein